MFASMIPVPATKLRYGGCGAAETGAAGGTVLVARKAMKIDKATPSRAISGRMYFLNIVSGLGLQFLWRIEHVRDNPIVHLRDTVGEIENARIMSHNDQRAIVSDCESPHQFHHFRPVSLSRALVGSSQTINRG